MNRWTGSSLLYFNEALKGWIWFVEVGLCEVLIFSVLPTVDGGRRAHSLENRHRRKAKYCRGRRQQQNVFYPPENSLKNKSVWVDAVFSALYLAVRQPSTAALRSVSVRLRHLLQVTADQYLRRFNRPDRPFKTCSVNTACRRQSGAAQRIRKGRLLSQDAQAISCPRGSGQHLFTGLIESLGPVWLTGTHTHTHTS